MRALAEVGLVFGAVALLAASPAPAAAQESGGDGTGKEVYDRWCAGCHGVDGAGDGPGAGIMLPRPRDFTRAQYQIRTTASGELPTDADILRIIDEGMPGTTMPGWRDVLTRSEREVLVPYLKSLSRFFGNAEAPPPLDFGKAPRATDERIEEGREIYQRIECWKCHGQAGRGDGTSAPTLEDAAGDPIFAADLTENWLFNGGGSVEDIYHRFRTGMDGTPMPTFSDLIDADIVSADQLWSLAHYVRSMAPEEAPDVREVLRAALLVEGDLPEAPDDERWDEVESYYVPLVGQIVLAPRWFNPRVDGLWVQALHDGEALALRVSWTDPSRSPDPAWADFAGRIHEAMEPKEGAEWSPGAPDRLVVQLPQTLSEGMERPHFLQGDSRRPAYLWVWESDTEGGREQVATGLGTGTDQPAASRQLQTSAVHEEGQWRVVFRRELSTPDSASDLQLPVGRAVPIAFQAWDGDNAESGHRAAISTWYLLGLEQPTPLTAYAVPAVALVLTGLLGMALVRQAKRKEREGTREELPARGVPAGSAAGD